LSKPKVNDASDDPLPSQRRSRFSRAPSGGFALGERDEALLCDLFLFRCLSREHIERLHFESTSRCNRRLRQLFDYGFVHRHYLALSPWGSPALYFPALGSVPAIGRELERRELDVDPGEIHRVCRVKSAPAYLEHTLACADFFLRVKEDIEVAQAQGLGIQLDLYLPETLCREEYDVQAPGTGWRREIFKPDAFFRLQLTGHRFASCFVEIDRGHVSSALFRAKRDSYRRYYETGLFAHAYGDDPTPGVADGADRASPKGSFLVLVVTTGRLRLSHLRAAVEEEMHARAGGGESEGEVGVGFRFTTFADLATGGLLGGHWQAPLQDETVLLIERA
jgi:hypothetical protein